MTAKTATIRLQANGIDSNQRIEGECGCGTAYETLETSRATY